MAIVCPVLDNSYLDLNGAPLSGGKLFFYQGGSFSVEKTTYQNAGATIPNTNPIVLDSSGYLTTPVFLGTGLYNIALTKADGTTVLNTWQNIEGIECDCGKDYFGGIWTTENQGLNYYAVDHDSSGNVFCVGRGYPGDPNGYGAVTKIDPSGEVLWNKLYGTATGSPLGTIFYNCRVTSDNNVIVAGVRSDDLTPFPQNSYNIVVAKINQTTGAMMWQRVLNATPGTGDMYEAPIGLCIDADDNVYVSFRPHTDSGYIVKYSNLGVLDWQVRLVGTFPTYMYDLAYDETNDTVTFTGGEAGIQSFGRINANDGSMIISHKYAVVQDSKLRGVAVDGAGYTYLLCSTPIIGSTFNLTICKVDSSYNIVWQRRYVHEVSIDVANTLWNLRYADGKLYTGYSYVPSVGGQYCSTITRIDAATGTLDYSNIVYNTQVNVSTPGLSVRDGYVAVSGLQNRVNPSVIGYISRFPTTPVGLGTYGWWTYAAASVTTETPTYTSDIYAQSTIASSVSDTAGNLVISTLRVTPEINELIV